MMPNDLKLSHGAKNGKREIEEASQTRLDAPEVVSGMDGQLRIWTPISQPSAVSSHVPAVSLKVHQWAGGRLNTFAL
jgi:hypothetical protein